MQCDDLYNASTMAFLFPLQICGHTMCGGVRAALSDDYSGMITHWLRAVKDVYERHAHELAQYEAGPAREQRLAELNVGPLKTQNSENTLY